MFVNHRSVTIQWGDCDPAGIVFYPRYFEMFDASTAALFTRALGEGKSRWRERYGIVGIPMVDTRARFLIPSVFGEEIVIETAVAEFRRSSFDVRHRVLKDNTLAIEAFETRVWVALDASRPGGIKAKAIHPEVIARLSGDPATITA